MRLTWLSQYSKENNMEENRLKDTIESSIEHGDVGTLETGDKVRPVTEGELKLALRMLEDILMMRKKGVVFVGELMDKGTKNALGGVFMGYGVKLVDIIHAFQKSGGITREDLLEHAI